MTFTKKRILILAFGGTIAMVPDYEAGGALVPAKSITQMLAMVPSLEEMAELHYEQLLNIDSTNINPSHWTMLAEKIADKAKNYDGIIVTHGTDTMAYTATAISFALGKNPPIPIVFTGSQLPLVDIGSDARFNLENSMKVVIQAAVLGINETMIVFSSHVFRANRSLKSSEARFDAFESPAFPELAIITAAGVTFHAHARRRSGDGEVTLNPRFQSDIYSVDLIPGTNPELHRVVIRSGLCKAIVFRSFGAGNVPSGGRYSLIPIISEAVATGIPVLVSTKFVGGNTRMDIYEPGVLALAAGAISTADMTSVAVEVKLMWALGQGHASIKELKRVMGTDYFGEVSVAPS